MCASLLVEEGNEIGLRASTLVLLWLLAALGEVFYSRVAGDALLLSCGLSVLSFGIDLRNQDSSFVLEIGSKLLPDGCERFAV